MSKTDQMDNLIEVGVSKRFVVALTSFLTIAMGGGTAWMTNMHLNSSASAESSSDVRSEVVQLRQDFNHFQSGYLKENLTVQKSIYREITEMNRRLSAIERRIN